MSNETTTYGAAPLGASERKLSGRNRSLTFCQRMTYCTYILLCNGHTKYYGHTQNLDKRFKQHLNGQVSYTKNKELKIVYVKEFVSLSGAVKHEKQLKNGRTRRATIEKLIDSYARQNVKDSIRTATYVH
jgi:predicted GIY-YIG superfamily endonuclease